LFFKEIQIDTEELTERTGVGPFQVNQFTNLLYDTFVVEVL